MKAHKRAHLRMARTFQHVELFAGMSVLDNIKLGCIMDIQSNFFGAFFRFGKSVREEMKYRRELEEKVMDFLDLNHVREQPVAVLPHGLQKRVDLARALAMNPAVILYDEPTTGLDPIRSDIINELVLKMQREFGVTSIVVTHDMKSAYKIADRIVMLHNGRVVADGDAEAIREHPHPVVQQFINGHVSEDDLAVLRMSGTLGGYYEI